MPVQISLGGRPCVDAIEEARNLARLGYPAPPEFARANCLLNPRGEQPARGWFLMLGADLALLNLNALLTLQMTDAYGNSAVAKGLVVAREPTCLTPSMTPNDPKACYLVEVADGRWRAHNPYFSVSIDRQYNVRAPGWGGLYYAETLYAPTTTSTTTIAGPTTTTTAPPTTTTSTPWTWTQMIGDIWWVMLPQLGKYPGLPQGFNPDGVPERFRYQGVSAWRALCQVLAKLGLAVAWKPANNTYSIVQVGGADYALATLLKLPTTVQRKIFDHVYPAVVRGRVPAGVRVHFHRVQEQYGSEPATAQDVTQFMTSNVYTIDVPASAAITKSAEPGTYHPLWDDLPALYDPSGNLLNAVALQTRAQNRANAYYATIQGTGGARRRQIYTGLLSFVPGSTISGVCWRQDLASLGDPAGGGGGLVTEIVAAPAMQLRVSDNGQFDEALPDSSALHPPDLRVKEPVWPDLLQVVRVVNPTPNADGTYDAAVVVWDSDNSVPIYREQCYVLPANQERLQARNYHARLMGSKSLGNGYEAPLYWIVAPALEWVKVTSPNSVTILLAQGTRTLTGASWPAAETILTAVGANFNLGDIGAVLTGTGIPAGTSILGILSPTEAIMSNAPTADSPPAGESVTVTNAQQGTLVVYPAATQTWDNETGTWHDHVSVWFYEVNGGVPLARLVYQCRLLDTDICGNPIWAAEICCTEEGFNTTSTTTTTTAPCTGSCKYTSSDGITWGPPTNGCATTTTTTTTSTTTTTGGPTTTTTTASCNPYAPTTTSSTTTTTTTTTVCPANACDCIPPSFCPTFVGECTYTMCGQQGCTSTTNNPCTTTTTGTTTTGTTTTTTGGPTTTTTCSPPPSPCSPYPCSPGGCASSLCCSSCVPCDCTPGGACFGGSCQCCCTVLPPWSCTGSCRWTCTLGGWVGVGNCKATGCRCDTCTDCNCDTPSIPCTPSICGTQVVAGCYSLCPPPPPPPPPFCPPPGVTTTTTATTTTAKPCSGDCEWQCNPGVGWELKKSTCNGGDGSCSCCPPPFTCDQSCLIVYTACLDPSNCATTTTTTATTTTSTTTTSTTTTTCVPAGNCEGMGYSCPPGTISDPSGGQCLYTMTNQCSNFNYQGQNPPCGTGYGCLCAPSAGACVGGPPCGCPEHQDFYVPCYAYTSTTAGTTFR